MLKKILIGLIALLLAAQLVRPPANAGTVDGPGFIGRQHPVPADVDAVLAKACYDCHSNQTHTPWYANVQPVGWWLAWHVKDGKKHLNFSEFASYPAKRQKHKLEEVADELREGKMPLKSYTWVHGDAVLTTAERQLLTDWANRVRGQIPLN